VSPHFYWRGNAVNFETNGFGLPPFGRWQLRVPPLRSAAHARQTRDATSMMHGIEDCA
jgi:hypothetical protein